MKYLVFILVFCLGILSQNVLSDKVESQGQLKQKIIFNFDNEAYNEESYVFEDGLPNNAACVCRNGSCVNEGGKEVCKCPPGFGNFTRTSCKACECGPDSNCMWEAGTFGSKVCFCKPGYNDKRGKCIDCDCGPDSNCTWTEENVFITKKVCHCKQGYHDVNGKCLATPCNSDPCKNGGKCTESGMSFTCECVKPYSGATCETSPCDKHPCQNGGTCNVGKVGYTCTCKSPYKGPRCEEDPCFSNPCRNGGKCKVNGNSFACDCPLNFLGETCHHECSCKNGKCRVTSDDNVLCECLPEYGKMSEDCIACNCGTGANCTWEDGLLGIVKSKYCLCPNGSKLEEKHCEVTETSTLVTTDSSSLMSTILTSTVSNCYCGENSKSCRFDWKGDKECTCSYGYAENLGYCDECNCGPYGSCSFGYNQKQCDCMSFAMEKNGVCVVMETTSSLDITVETSTVLSSTAKDCYCGSFSYSCSMDLEGNRLCSCFFGYSQLGGLCAECNCGPYGTCSFEYGRKKCNCRSFAVEMNGVCLDVRTTSEITTGNTESSTIVSSTQQDCYCGENSKSCRLDRKGDKICNCFSGYSENYGYCDECNCGPYGYCSFKYGQKQCGCRSFAIEKNGVCVVLETTSSGDTTVVTSTILPSTAQDCHCGSFSYSCSLDSDGNKLCNCFMGYSQLGGSCAECNCGPYGTCSFAYGRKKCNCISIATEMNGLCVDIGISSSKGTTESFKKSTVPSSTMQVMETTTSEDTSVVTSTIIPPTVQDCHCGSFSYSCSWDSVGKKVCSCYRGYSQLGGTCAACYCGENSKSCRFDWRGVKECNCSSGYAEYHGYCNDCYCGENSKSCRFDLRGVKKCNCSYGYAENHGFCDECNCGPYGSCRFEHGQKQCDCKSFTTEKNGMCVAICSEDKCLNGKCEVIGNGSKCRCNEGFTGIRCEYKIPTKSNKEDLWKILLVSIIFAIFILLSGVLCTMTRMLNKRSNI